MTKRQFIIGAVFAALIGAFSAVAQSSYPSTFGGLWQYRGLVPSSPTSPYTATVYLDQINLSNTSASAVTCLLVDRTTDCGGAACELWPNVSIDADRKYTASLGGEAATNGFSLSCSTNNVVYAWIKGKQ